MYFQFLLSAISKYLTEYIAVCNQTYCYYNLTSLMGLHSVRKDFRIGPPKISHFATLEWQKTMLEAKRRLNFDAEMQ